MITAYSGEFTISPIPLELTMNYCSHKCAYCFANLNKPGREVDMKALIAQLRNHKNQNNLTAFLLQEKYPVLISNKVDPFAKTNFRQTISIVEILESMGIPQMYQTKGGDGVDDVLSMIRPSVWYISISMIDEEIRRNIEPGAPSIQSRFGLIDKLKKAGHAVSVGVNPIVGEWLPHADIETLCQMLKDHGIDAIWAETLHLNHRQIANMSEKEKAAIGDEILSRSQSRKEGHDAAYAKFADGIFRNAGIDVFSMNQYYTSDYFEKYHKTYPGKTLKTHQDFINYLKRKDYSGEVTFAEYYEFMKSDFFEKKFSDCDGYIYSIARNIHAKINGRVTSFREVLRTYWNYPEIAKSIATNKLFRVLRDREGKQDVDLIDAEGNFILWFDKTPSNSWVKYVKGGD